jgi:ssDNA-binding Zn-finger/Zn-ribbon topoisomerase 1
MPKKVDLDELEKRYAEKPVPKCPICGDKMTIQRMECGQVTYGCAGRRRNSHKFKPGRTLADEHYSRSRVTIADRADRDVLAAIRELRALREKTKKRR